ncbi:MAG: class I SAM-dependent methyltransferase [Phycisphaerae bacterium]|nr:class I SAM-dependent methyltransferase [Phycisphaerae bacterium]
MKLGPYLSYWLHHSPRRMLYAMAYYSFAAALIGRGRRVLDVGCSEGMGTQLLALECGYAEGLDINSAFIATARRNWRHPSVRFRLMDVFKHPPIGWDAIVAFDVVEHLTPRRADVFLGLVARGLRDAGIAVIGTPSITGQAYASRISRAGHINCYSGERLEEAMREYFTHVFMFGANDEVVHTGFLPMAHYLIGVGCGRHE